MNKKENPSESKVSYILQVRRIYPFDTWSSLLLNRLLVSCSLLIALTPTIVISIYSHEITTYLHSLVSAFRRS